MTLAISTSSPLVSVALIRPDGSFVEQRRMAQGAASCTVAEMTTELLGQNGLTPQSLQRVAVDIGPGAFTGLRVGVTMAKSLAWALSVPVIAALSFDLVSTTQTVAVPFKRGQWIVRRFGQEPTVQTVVEPETMVGYGSGFPEERFPSAGALSGFLGEVVNPLALVPYYLVEPSISKPNRPELFKEST